MPEEGVIQFELDHQPATLGGDELQELARELDGWRNVLVRLGLLGQDPARYGGLGFGNVSARLAPPGADGSFLITGTQTGALAHLALPDFCQVLGCDASRNRVASRGRIRPSSEAMTHAAFYAADPGIRFVFHVHAPAIWRAATALGLPSTPAAIGYGTPQMAAAVSELLESRPDARVLAMGGHEDGVLSFGGTSGEAGAALVRAEARAAGAVD